jgi:P4 family phage/plasmid primase-like protien
MSERSRIVFRATTESPCPVCNSGTKGCSGTKDGFHLCRGESANIEFVRVSEADDAGFLGYRLRKDDKANPVKQKVKRAKKSNTQQANPKTVTDFTSSTKRYVEEIRPAHRELLARRLQLPVAVFERIPLLGVTCMESQLPVFGFPEMDDDGNVCGIIERRDKEKKMLTGGSRGLTIPTGWNDFSQADDGQKYLFLVEGASDTLAMTAAGLHALGRPSAKGSNEILCSLLSKKAAELKGVQIVVMAEYDQKSDGSWPGKEGAEKCNRLIQEATHRPVVVLFPPDEEKDVRDWFTRESLKETDWAERGRLFMEFVMEQLQTAQATATSDAGSSSSSARLSGVGGEVDYPVVGRFDRKTQELIELRGTNPDKWPYGPTNSNQLAYLFLKSLTTPDGYCQLIYWNKMYHLYSNGCYATVDKDWLESYVNFFCQTEVQYAYELRMDIYNQKSVEARGAMPKVDDINDGKISNVLKVILRHCAIPDETKCPSWRVSKSDADRELHRPKPENIVCTLNGLVDVVTEKRFEHTPAYFNFCQSDFCYDAAAPLPERWLKFMEESWGDDVSQIESLQEWMGYYLTSATNQQKFLFLRGDSGTGKSTIGNVIRALVGERNTTSPQLAGLINSRERSVLYNKTLAIFSDVNLGNSKDSPAILETLLSVTGQDMMNMDEKYGKPFQIKLNTRLLLIANQYPQLPDKSKALRRRMILLDMTRKPAEVDSDLSNKFLEEIPGIFLWSLVGLRRMLQRGNFVQPEVGKQVIDEHGGIGNSVEGFVQEMCVLDVNAITADKNEMYKEYEKYCDDTNVHILQRDKFFRDLHSAYPNRIKSYKPRSGGKQIKGFHGIRMIAFDESPKDNDLVVSRVPTLDLPLPVSAPVSENTDENTSNSEENEEVRRVRRVRLEELEKNKRKEEEENRQEQIRCHSPSGSTERDLAIVHVSPVSVDVLPEIRGESTVELDESTSLGVPDSPPTPIASDSPTPSTTQPLVDWMYVSRKLEFELIPGPPTTTGEPDGLPIIDLGGREKMALFYRLTIDTLVWFEHAIDRYIAKEPGQAAIATAVNDRAKLHLFVDQHPNHFLPAKVNEARQHAATHGAKDLPEWKEPPPF